MIEGIARSRINRAFDTRTQAPGEVLKLSVGDLVDFYRPPVSQDVPGWRGQLQSRMFRTSRVEQYPCVGKATLLNAGFRT
eukprot:2858623-Lingulodinium_polyedra.AAC.1